MSYITEVVVFGAREQEIEPLNKWLYEEDSERHQQLMPINMDAAGGTKYFTTKVWAAAFNYVPIDLTEKLKDPATWGYHVRLISVVIRGEEYDEAFVFEKVDGKYQPVVIQEWLT